MDFELTLLAITSVLVGSKPLAIVLDSPQLSETEESVCIDVPRIDSLAPRSLIFLAILAESSRVLHIYQIVLANDRIPSRSRSPILSENSLKFGADSLNFLEKS